MPVTETTSSGLLVVTYPRALQPLPPAGCPCCDDCGDPDECDCAEDD